MLLWTLEYMYLFELVVFFFFWYMPRSGIPGLYGNSIFSFLRKLQTVLHSSSTSLHSHQQRRMVPFSPHLLQHLLFVDFFDNDRSEWCEVISHAVLICAAIIISNVENLFMWLFDIYVFFGEMSVEICPFFWLGCLFSWYGAIWVVCIFWKWIPCQSHQLQIFFPILLVALFCLWFPLLFKSFYIWLGCICLFLLLFLLL